MANGEEVPVAFHLTASMKVLRAHQRRRHVTVSDPREAIKQAAYLTGIGEPGPETQALVVPREGYGRQHFRACNARARLADV
jgi:hypothetical protein